MKKLAFAFLLSFSFAGMTSPILGFADGRYLGAGDWRDDAGNSGNYESYLEFSSNNSRADYAWSDGTTTIELAFSFDAFGNFSVSQNGTEVGSGFCMSVQCQYSASLSNGNINEVFTFNPTQLLKLGWGQNASGTNIYWEETLWNLPATMTTAEQTAIQQ